MQRRRCQGELTEEKTDESQRSRKGRKTYPAESPPDKQTTERRRNVDLHKDRTPPVGDESTWKVEEKMLAIVETSEKPQND
ncbi:hypothetical protein NDU88_008549 [Pleurodeles waltl]|uniref:Uncharacterized protein n=1 Tax=Pleurodeles waltl TaxID=8319 RepID=A0AAV7P0K9_PLEWA|nr:hypothetical protein NDU88_008549 [Pleurodeles waltl]